MTTTVRHTRTTSSHIPPVPQDPKRPARRWVLSQRSLERIAAYQYHSGPYTIIETAMNPYWNWVVHFLPMWAAPNLVTLCGLLWCVASFCVVLYFSPTLSDELPAWVCYFCTFSLFAYQTLDAVDGKQARRTGSSSPLGQLFDHGCDALNMVFTCTTLAGLWQLGTHPWLTLNVLFNVFIAFYMAQWEEYHTGTMMTSNGVVGVTEGQFIQMGIGLFSAWFGAGLWATPLLSLQWGGPVSLCLVVTVKALAMTGGTLLTLWVSISSLVRVLLTHTSGDLTLEEVGDKELGMFHAFSHLLPAVLSFTLGVMWTVGHGQVVFRTHNTMVVAALGLTVAYLSTRMTVMHMAKQPFGHAELLLPILLQAACVVNTYWQVLELPRVGSFPVGDEVALWWYTIAIFVIYAYFVVGVIHDICVFLEVRCFRIKPKSSQPAASS